MSRLGRAAVQAALFLFFSVLPLAAEQVTLSLSDGSFSVTGDLLEFDGEHYQIESQFGVLTMASDTTQCLGAACPDAAAIAPVVQISGAAAMGDLLIPTLIESFAAARGYTVDVTTDPIGVIVIHFWRPGLKSPLAEFRLSLSSTARGIADMLFGKSQIVMARRALTPGENLAIQSRFADANGAAVRSIVLGWENLRLYTSSTNTTRQLTVSELIAMVEELPSFWPNADGVGLPVTLQGDFDSVSALRQVLGFSTATPLLNSSQNTPAGLLRISPDANLPLAPVELIATCGVHHDDHVNPQDQYPLKSPLNMFVAPTDLPPIARDFWAYLLTPRAQAVVTDLGYFSRTPSELNLSSDNRYLLHAILNMDADMRAQDLQNAVQGLYGYSRLSLTFRFLEGTEVLDDESETNLGFLANLLKRPDYQERSIIFAGFSDSDGSADGNLKISLNRAQALRGTIRNIMGDQTPSADRFRALGFGEALPLACNDTGWGQNQNRRVEIWLK